MATGSLARAGMVLARDGKAECAIVLADGAIPSERTAAKELAEHLKAVTGAEFQIKAEGSVGQGDAAIVIGTSDRMRKMLPDVDWAALGHDGIVIRTVGKQLVLTGGRPRGALYATYTLLEDHVGCKWWTSTERTIPRKPTLQVGDLNIVYVPKIVYRESFNADVINANYVQAGRLKLNGHMTDTPANWGGHYTLIGWCHTVYDLLPPGTYFAKHPEWYSEINGKRQADWGQLCWSNPEMRKELAQNALRKIRKNPSAGIISISQNDWGNPCACTACKAADDEDGSHIGSLLRGLNVVAGEIEREYPDFLVETLAYQFTRKPPKVTRPAKNVLIRLCSIEADFAHPLSTQDFGNDLRQWSRIAPNLFVWNYVTSFANYLIPQPNLLSIGPDIKFFADHKVVGLFEQGDAYNKGVGDFLQLRTWMQAKLMWNPELDQAKVMAEFLDGYYGPAGKYLGQYLEMINAPTRNPGFHVGCYNTDTSFITPEKLKEAEAIFDRAANVVAGNEDLSRRVRIQRLVIDYLRLTRYDFAAALRTKSPEQVEDDFSRRVEEFISLATKYGAQHISEPQDFASYAAGLRMMPVSAIPPRIPAAGEDLPPGAFVIQDPQFQLHGKGDWADLKSDQKASDGQAAVMPGGHVNWAVQYHVPKDAPFVGKGPWRCFVLVRCDVKQKAGSAFRVGLFDPSGGRPIADQTISMGAAGDGEYHAYGVLVDEIRPGMYFWVCPPGNVATVPAVYVDRIFIQRYERKKQP